jgi:hypothetical protein
LGAQTGGTEDRCDERKKNKAAEKRAGPKTRERAHDGSPQCDASRDSISDPDMARTDAVQDTAFETDWHTDGGVWQKDARYGAERFRWMGTADVELSI